MYAGERKKDSTVYQAMVRHKIKVAIIATGIVNVVVAAVMIAIFYAVVETG